ncbi:transcriptional regulator GcvA [Thalassotalea mangrovi]|uniref:Transcriptional regulator GcvA n=1 Tax=Thalassotalea mangrovi TaxID=2572245 RepID=A0A4U1B2U3_9GAMM|nr:transcriptional regulator GcvA [Thalassotalea mangrovi]TKB43515.1 transcriptional regulator GcvA [Thalassotalea mangrovi]
MATRLPPLNALKAFEASARHLSFTKAADELFVTQAAVSHQIKSLENHLGIKLFMRKNRALLLTEEGQGYYLDIKDIFTSLQDATQRLLARNSKGAINVSVHASLAIQWLVPRLSEFNRLYPDIDVRITADDRDEGTLSEDVDIAFYYGRGHWPGLIADKMMTEYLQPVCSPAFLEDLSSKGQLAQISDLAEHTLLHDTSRRDWKRFFKNIGISTGNVDRGPIFSHTALVLQAAVYGQGIALGHNLLAKPELEAGRLVAPFPEVLVNKDAFYIVCRSPLQEGGRIAQFREWVLTTVAEEEQAIDEDKIN